MPPPPPPLLPPPPPPRVFKGSARPVAVQRSVRQDSQRVEGKKAMVVPVSAFIQDKELADILNLALRTFAASDTINDTAGIARMFNFTAFNKDKSVMTSGGYIRDYLSKQANAFVSMPVLAASERPKKRAKKSKAIEIIHSKVGTLSRRIVHNAIEYINSNWRKSFRIKADTQDARNELSRAMTEIHRKKITFQI